jgi:IS5 family transposase
MRIKINPQRSIFDYFGEHKLGKELSAISMILDEYPELYELASKDLIRVDAKSTGRKGLTVESVVRCAILKQHRQLTYEELAFHLEDSQSFKSFARLDGKAPKKSVLQKTITLIKPSTWEQINRKLLEISLVKKVEDGNKIRIDSTVTEANIHHPSDNTLLWDSVRITVRLLQIAEKLDGAPKINYCDRSRKAKRLSFLIRTVKEKKRRKYYRELVRITKEELGYLQQTKQQLEQGNIVDLAYIAWAEEVCRYEGLITQIITQTERRVFNGESVPAVEKIVSLFEEHTDIIAKANRVVKFGHKLNLTTGKTSLILDAAIEKGNPADSKCLIPMLKRQIEIYGEAPDKASVDGGYASKENLYEAKQLGVKDMAFHKKRGLAVEDMVKSKWVYKQLRNFRAGIEANISCLKRAYGLARCTWKGWEKFKAYVWSSIVSYNLSLLAKLLSKPG